jgi:uncharacterized protein with PQ loop repeat
VSKKKTKITNIDKLTMVIGLGMPLVCIPQLITALTTSDVHSISLITWVYFTFQAAVFSIFSIRHKEKPLVFTYVPLFFIQLGIVITILVRSV